MSLFQQRIPITKGWWPCKRKHWVLVNEQYQYTDPYGINRSYEWHLGLDPTACTPMATFYGTHGDFRPSGSRLPGYHDAGCRDARSVMTSMAVPSYRSMMGGNDMFRQLQLEEKRPEDDDSEFRLRREREARYHEGMQGYEKKFTEYLDAYADATSQPVSDEKLAELKKEAEDYAERKKQHEFEQYRRDQIREWQLEDAAQWRALEEDIFALGNTEVIGTLGLNSGRKRVQFAEI
jgi:hypothetical protein